ncbi:OmpA family protein [Paracoccus sp. PS-1]|uniref:OmpA family protein n=1 Tax=unclassified Paracoccus (in: a-proteobacteria) TaxID=2688777 RepID=UPI00048F51B3|nr:MULTISPECIES: OmpA family protein [unclassified Paracoccus (in: a-proteobacteria)]MDQ7263425.1 OmpA family protein [Paracoccus sp. PS1]RQP05553.1 MAG: OmpA family protein [Paracoccus sp. BP8]UFM66699.1 OmpA family protein [Paracoccus sp. MA]
MKTRISLLLASAGVIAISACAPTDPSGQPQQMSRTQQGAVAGAVVGGLIGAGESRSNAVKGAIIGATAGAVGGSILDQQQRALQQSLNNPNIRVVNHGTHLSVIMPETTLFATDSAAVGAQGQNDLYTIARNLNQYPNSRIQVIGHTDSTGSAAYNQDLSERRARSVAGILTAGGVSQNRVTTAGRGATQPVASNDTAAGRAQNRRVEILIVPTN